MESLLKTAIITAWQAGKEIMKVYEKDFAFESKADNSPLTAADLAAHQTIKNALEFTGFPLLSEEGKMIPYEQRKNWETFWLVDPLDGTKEFIKRNGEFTVNIALIVKGIPVLGVVYVPVTEWMYAGAENEGSILLKTGNDLDVDFDSYLSSARVLQTATSLDQYTIVASRTHSSPETERFIEEKTVKHGSVNLVSSGSSIKLCMIAEGKANVYPRLAPTMEWDTAAGHAVAKYAGGTVYDYHTKRELTYNKENLLNPWFIVEGKIQ